ncbi:hypothetical protein AMECASPLE_000559 [Ameca splendens]|uniref:Uncharacterized protein n=1 Tax=Ameca splendens TaxID=208324 RepID=A0ABV0ZIJ9_9TELE
MLSADSKVNGHGPSLRGETACINAADECEVFPLPLRTPLIISTLESVVSFRLCEMIIVMARRALSLLACLTSLTTREQAARLNDKVIPANPS